MEPLLRTKYRLPYAHPNRVSRPHLIQKLDENLWHTKNASFLRRLTLVAAPAGYGKTSLLWEWASHLGIPVAWISFEEADNNPYRFIQYLVASLQTIQPGFGEAILDCLRSPQFTNTSELATNLVPTLVNEIAKISQPFLFVFDDYHTLETQEIHRAVKFFIDHLPENLSLVIATRADPPLQLSRLRAMRQMVEIRSSDLRFSESEAGIFLRQVMRLNIKDHEVVTLSAYTEGWIAGLQMAALALEGRDDSTDFIRDFSGRERFVIDYLFEEVLSRQPESIQAFLIQTSILDTMTGPLCDAVLKKADTTPTAFTIPEQPGQQVLEYLERSNLFIVSMDSERCFYRYHHLFGDLLRHRLQRTFPEQISNLHARAAAWFETQGAISDALRHWIMADNFQSVVRLVEKFGYDFFAQGNFPKMLAWLEQIPKEIIHTRPWLNILYSLGLIFTGKITEGEIYLSSAENSLPPAEQTADLEIKKLWGHIAAIRCYLSALNLDVEGNIREASMALKYLPLEDLFTRSIVSYLITTARMTTGDLEQAEQDMLTALRWGKEAGNKLVAVNAVCALSNLSRVRGKLHHAFDILKEAAHLVTDERGRSLPMISEVYLARALLYYEWNDLKSAETDLSAALDISKYYANTDALFQCLATLSIVRLAQGERHAAEQLFHEIEQTDQQGGASLDFTLQSYKMRFYLAGGDPAMAAEFAGQQGWAVEGKSIYTQYPMFIFQSKVFLWQKKLREAFQLLAECVEKLRSRGFVTPVIKAFILQAIILEEQGEHAPALMRIGEALSMAEAEGFVRIFVDEGDPARSMLIQYRASISHKSTADEPANLRILTYISQLLSAFPGFTTEVRAIPPSADQNIPSLVESLTTREMEVIGLIADGFSNKEIAEKLVVSIGTVKAHTTNIYRKLDVPGRTRAVAKAREIHII